MGLGIDKKSGAGKEPPTEQTAENCYEILCDPNWRNTMADHIEKEIKELGKRFKEEEKKYPEAITTEEIADLEHKFRRDVLETSKLIEAQQTWAAYFVLNNPDIVAQSTLKSDKIKEMLIRTAYVAPLNTVFMNQDIVRYPGTPFSSFVVGPLRVSTIPTATRTEPTDKYNDIIQTEMLRQAAFRLSIAHPDAFFHNIDDLQKAFGQKEKFENEKPNWNDISNGVRAYFRKKNITKENIDKHIVSVENNVVRMTKYGQENTYEENLALFEGALTNHLGKKLEDYERRQIAYDTEQAYLVRLYGDKAQDISGARFAAMVREAAQFAAIEKESRGKITPYIEKWMPYFKQSPQAAAQTIIGLLPFSQKRDYFSNPSPHDKLIKYLKDNPEDAVEIIHAIASQDRDIILQQKFQWTEVFENDPQKIAEITLAAITKGAPEDASSSLSYENLSGYILKHTDRLKERPDIVIGALLSEEKRDPIAVLAINERWRHVLKDQQIIRDFDDKIIDTAREYLKKRPEHALEHADVWLSNFSKMQPAIASEILLESAANEPELVIDKKSKIDTAFAAKPEILNEIITIAARNAATKSPTTLVQHTYNWLPAFKENHEEADKLLIDAAKSVSKTDPRTLILNSDALVRSYMHNPKELRGLIGDAVKKDLEGAWIHSLDWLPIYKAAPDELVALINQIPSGEAKNRLRDALYKNIAENPEKYQNLQMIKFEDKNQSSLTPPAPHPFAVIAERSKNPLPYADMSTTPEGRANSPAQNLLPNLSV